MPISPLLSFRLLGPSDCPRVPSPGPRGQLWSEVMGGRDPQRWQWGGRVVLATSLPWGGALAVYQGCERWEGPRARGVLPFCLPSSCLPNNISRRPRGRGLQGEEPPQDKEGLGQGSPHPALGHLVDTDLGGNLGAPFVCGKMKIAKEGDNECFPLYPVGRCKAPPHRLSAFCPLSRLCLEAHEWAFYLIKLGVNRPAVYYL